MIIKISIIRPDFGNNQDNNRFPQRGRELRKAFRGMYYKHQKGDDTVSLIAGISVGSHAFIQVVTNQGPYYFSYPQSEYKSGRTLRIGGNTFSENGVKIRLEENGIKIRGKIKYTGLTPVKHDIMGPFRYLPMQCRHKITSLSHRLEGYLIINGKPIDFTEGTGYIEGDSGVSFPRSYVWVQCNDFPEKACITASVADIPFAGTRFRGCICIVYINDTQYRLATYLGVRILALNERRIVLEQGRLKVEIEIDKGTGHILKAPENGEMTREIRERISCGARFRFIKDEEVIFEKYSKNASVEIVK